MVMGRAAELGVTHLDTSDLYGHGNNEILVGKTPLKTAVSQTLVPHVHH